MESWTNCIEWPTGILELSRPRPVCKLASRTIDLFMTYRWCTKDLSHKRHTEAEWIKTLWKRSTFRRTRWKTALWSVWWKEWSGNKSVLFRSKWRLRAADNTWFCSLIVFECRSSHSTRSICSSRSRSQLSRGPLFNLDCHPSKAFNPPCFNPI